MAGKFIGNKCSRGADFALREKINLKRIVTTTVKVRDGYSPLVSVKTKVPVEKNRVPEIMKKLHKVNVGKNVKINDVVCVLTVGTQEIPVIATANSKEMHKSLSFFNAGLYSRN